MAGSVITATVYNDKIDLADDIEEDFRLAAEAGVRDAAQLLLDKVRDKLQARRGTARTSAPPGEPPEYDEGDLFRSWKLLPTRLRGRMAESGIKSNNVYAVRLEYGKTDKRGVRTFPHPYVRPAMKEVEPAIFALWRERFT
jgi:hypothetical protein